MMDRPNYVGNNALTGLFSEMVIDEQVRQYRKRTLYTEIDEALAMKNKEKFLLLTNELREIMSYEQSVRG